MSKIIRVTLTIVALAFCATLVGGCTSKARMARHQARADAYFATGDFSRAEVEYLVALRFDQSNAHALSRLGEIYFQQGRFLPAYSYVEKACELVTNEIDLHVKLGMIYLLAHKSKEACDQAEFVLDRSPTNADAPDILAESAVTRAELDQAQNRLEKLSKQIGDSAPLELAFGILAYARGDEKAAQSALQHALTMDPQYSAAYYSMGKLYFAQHKLKEADAAFKQAADLAPLRSPRRLSYANFKIQTGDLEDGKRLIAQITKDAPDYVPAWIREAEIAMAEKKFGDCSSLLNQALARAPGDYDALLLQGRLLILEGKANDAAAQMDRMATLYPRSAQALYYLAVAHVAMKDKGKAKADLSKALFLQPKSADAILLLAGLNISSGDTLSAIGALTQLLKEQPELGQAYLLLGNAYTGQGNFDQALAAYGKMAELDPKNPQVPVLMGILLLQKKDMAGARRQFEKSLELSPGFMLAQESLVNLDIQEGKFTLALNRLGKETDEKVGLAREILIAKVYLARAQSVARKENHSNSPQIELTSPTVKDDVNQAEASLQKAIALAPERDTAYLLLAQLYASAGKEQVALDHLKGFVAKTNDAAAYMEIGSIYETMKAYPKARDAYEKAIALEPDFASALNNLAYLYTVRLGDLDKGVELAKKAYRVSPTPSAADTLGWALCKKGDYARARPLLEDSASKISGQPEVQLHLGIVRYMMGDEEPARAPLQQAATSTEDFPGKGEAAKALATLAVNPETAGAKVQSDLEQQLREDPNDPVAASRLAAIYQREGMLAKAAKLYEQLTKQSPQNGQYFARLASIDLDLNRADQALAVATQARKLLPEDPTVACLLGRLAFQRGDYNWAASLLQEAAPKVPEQSDAQYDLAWSLYSMGRVNDAERTMKTAAPRVNGARRTDANLFQTMVAAARTPNAAATAQAEQILGTNADYVPAMMVLAIQAEQQGRADDALKLYNMALTHYPSFWPAARNLSILSARHSGGDDQQAYDIGTKARAVYPDDINLEQALGVLAYRRGDYAGAARLLSESSQALNGDGEIFFYLGMAQYQLKHMQQSKVALQRALSLPLETKSAEAAHKVLSELK